MSIQRIQFRTSSFLLLLYDGGGRTRTASEWHSEIFRHYTRLELLFNPVLVISTNKLTGTHRMQNVPVSRTECAAPPVPVKRLFNDDAHFNDGISIVVHLSKESLDLIAFLAASPEVDVDPQLIPEASMGLHQRLHNIKLVTRVPGIVMADSVADVRHDGGVAPSFCSEWVRR